jgi:NAD+-dependent protein deacetylase SIR2
MGQDVSHELIDNSIPPRNIKSRTAEGVADLIHEGKAGRIVVLTGAGISTSAGIPDFRSPDTGIYANLAKLNLPYAEAVFDISYFRHNPRPFYALARELYPGKYFPTVAHSFIALLAKKGLLHMLFTQNIDCLERAAGVPEEKIVEAHGSFATQRCIECSTPYPMDLMKEAIENGQVPRCQDLRCDGLVKPDIVFFGESLPKSFNTNVHKVSMADLLIIMGTSLSVHPFASLADFAREGVPRVLLNLERVGGIGSRIDDVCIIGDCDAGVRKLADALGWREEVEALWKEASKDAVEAEEQTQGRKSKDEILEEEIAKLTSEVDHSLKISNDHKHWLESHLEKKIDAAAYTEPEQKAESYKDSEERTINTSSSKLEDALNNSYEDTLRDKKGRESSPFAPAKAETHPEAHEAQKTTEPASEALVAPSAAPHGPELPSVSESANDLATVPAETSGPNTAERMASDQLIPDLTRALPSTSVTESPSGRHV